jgi:GTP-binding protein
VGDESGITRDRIYGQASYLGRPFELIDTGGIIPNDEEFIPSQILKQARVALAGASHVIFLIDGRAEIAGAERELASMLRKLGKPVTLAVNKIDSSKREGLAHEFHSLGFEHLFPISAEHRIGFDDLLEHVTHGFPVAEAVAETPESEPVIEEPVIKVAIIGRPNVGKSTLLNALTGSERAIVSAIAGTTRDAVDETVRHSNIDYVFVDTAGIRRKGKTKLMAEKLSVVMARRHLRMSHVAVLVLDENSGKIKTHKLGRRSIGKGAGIGILLAVIAPPTLLVQFQRRRSRAGEAAVHLHEHAQGDRPVPQCNWFALHVGCHRGRDQHFVSPYRQGEPELARGGRW